VSGYKINIKISHIFINNNKVYEKEIIPFMIVPKRIKYQGVHLTKKVRDLYTEKLQKINERN
jgi:hypothetical protein